MGVVLNALGCWQSGGGLCAWCVTLGAVVVLVVGCGGFLVFLCVGDGCVVVFVGGGVGCGRCLVGGFAFCCCIECWRLRELVLIVVGSV